MSSSEISKIWEFPIGDSLLLFKADSRDIYALNDTAAYAWSLLKSGKSVSDAAEAFAYRYGIPLSLALCDIESTWKSWSGELLAPGVVHAEEAALATGIGEVAADDFCADYLYCGKTIRVLLDAEIVADEIRPRIASLLTSSIPTPDVHFRVTASSAGYSVLKDSVVIATKENVADARITFLQEFVRSARAEADLLAVFHAAACGDENCCILIPGSSQSGKTTLAAALMHAGLLLYAEDTVMLEVQSAKGADARDRAEKKVPMAPFSLMIREGSWPVLSSRFPELLDAPRISRSGTGVRFLQPPWDGEEKCAAVSAIVFVRFQSGTSTYLKSISAFESIVRLKEIGFWVRHDYESTASFVNWLLAVPMYELTYSDLDEAIPAVCNLLPRCEEYRQSYFNPGKADPIGFPTI